MSLSLSYIFVRILSYRIISLTKTIIIMYFVHQATSLYLCTVFTITRKCALSAIIDFRQFSDYCTSCFLYVSSYSLPLNFVAVSNGGYVSSTHYCLYHIGIFTRNSYTPPSYSRAKTNSSCSDTCSSPPLTIVAVTRRYKPRIVEV